MLEEGEVAEGKGGTRGDGRRLGVENVMQYTGDAVFQNCTPDTRTLLLACVPPVNSKE